MQYITTFQNADFNESPFCKGRTGISYVMAHNLNQEFRMPTEKTIFGLFGEDSTLRAFRIEKFIFTVSGIVKGAYDSWGYAYVNVAGLGRMWIAVERSSYIYGSVDEYRRYNGLPINAEWLFNGKAVTLNQLAKGRLGIRLYEGDRRAEFVSYGWVNNRLDYGGASMRITYYAYCDSIIVEDTKKDGYPYYNAAQCVAENDVNVVTFEDEGQREYEVEIEVIKTITTTIKCGSKESAVNAAKTAFEGKTIKVFVNGEIEYESN